MESWRRKLQTELKRHYTDIPIKYRSGELIRAQLAPGLGKRHTGETLPVSVPPEWWMYPAFAYAEWCMISGRNQRWRIMFRFVIYKFALSYTHRIVNISLCHLAHVALQRGVATNTEFHFPKSRMYAPMPAPWPTYIGSNNKAILSQNDVFTAKTSIL